MEFEVEINQAGFEGNVLIKFPTRQEKTKMLQELKSFGYGKGQDSDELTDEKLKMAEMIGNLVDERLVSVNIVHKESGIYIKDKSMLDVYSECQALVGVIGNFILGGIPLGKPKN